MGKHLTVALPDPERIQIFQDRFAFAPDGSWPTPYEDLERKWKVDRFQLRTIMIDVLKRGLVRIAPADEVRKLVRFPDLERPLERVFHVSMAAVIEATPPPGTGPGEANDFIHEQLGRGAGEILSRGLCRPHDHIAIGPGRSTYHAANYLAALPPIGLPGIELVSLSGSYQPKSHATHPNLSLDADRNMYEMAPWFDPEKVTTHEAAHRLVCKSVQEARKARELGSLSKSLWKVPPSLAIVGVGVLRPGHRMHDAVEEPAFRPIRPELRRLIDLCNTHSTATYCPVLDVASRLHAIPSEGRGPLQPRIYREIERLVAAINDRTIAVTTDQLKQIRSIFLIAGTRQKTAAIRYLLREYPVAYLCTDPETARILASSHS